MTAPDSQRLQALTAAFGQPTVAHPPLGADTAAGADVQRMTTPQIDALLRRVAALTSILQGRNGADWDEIDRLAAQVLMSDLAIITSMTRALNELSASRLSEALADLAAAGQDADRVLNDGGSTTERHG